MLPKNLIRNLIVHQGIDRDLNNTYRPIIYCNQVLKIPKDFYVQWKMYENQASILCSWGISSSDQIVNTIPELILTTSSNMCFLRPVLTGYMSGHIRVSIFPTTVHPFLGLENKWEQEQVRAFGNKSCEFTLAVKNVSSTWQVLINCFTLRFW